jgi:hypothetical protein
MMESRAESVYYYSLLPVAACLHIVDEYVYPGGFLDAMKETAPGLSVM